VTGAGSGLGQAIAIRLARPGASVICADIVEELAVETAEVIQQEGGTARPVMIDVTNREQVEELVGSVDQLDIMCNTAAIINDLAVVDVPESELDRIFAGHKGPRSTSKGSGREG
jgi:NAD(P)-dependent dehydrogenase (short-subunit alcohol dehydrogenase family)